MAEPSMNVLMKFVVALAAAVVMTLIIFQLLHTNSYAATQRWACRNSVDIMSSSRMGAIDLSGDINCPTEYKKIEGTNQKKIKSEIAESMRDCWWQFREGERDLFGGPKIYCVVCSVIRFEEKEQKINGFTKYLMQTTMPGDEDKRTYFEYFEKFGTEEAERVVGKIDTKLLEEEQLETSKEYAVMFVYAKGKDEVKKIAQHLGGETVPGKIGLALGVGLGAGGAIISFASLAFIVSNPVGWAFGIGVAIFGIVEAVTYMSSPENAPEWISLVTLTEFKSESINALGCAELPAKHGGE